MLPEPVVRPDAVGYYAALAAAGGAWPSEAMCLTVVRGLSVAEASDRFDAPLMGHAATLVDVARAATTAFPDELPLVVADHVDGWALLGEENGYHGAGRDVLAALSVGTVAASVYWNVEYDSLLMVACDGRVLSALEFGGAARGGDRPDAARPYLDGLPFGERPRAAGLAFLERFSGVRLPGDWPTRELPAAVVVGPERFRPANPRAWLRPGDEPSHEPARAVAERACRAHGVVPGDEPLARAHAEYRAALHLRWRRCLPLPESMDVIERLHAEMRRRDADTGEERAAAARAHALAAVAASAEHDPVTATGWALYNAAQADEASRADRHPQEWIRPT
ncbi:DUF6461 domain-containing protein [Actinosynnema sp. NPDC047251]|uniref:Uncharacterized protein n=1 Tax=Saccharothrix espanaensis (strain ATCC 51144 / DSM 44229 / JCM 9112 / NBRC 15066 / NRRL 15764) TaxID=1179773 RepID=K0JW95_SACES|nr:DUF6461 domain-containing protein [Saccharothrix espanaensis]CCH32080.1 hypothetical protein BN6_48060 [Saccharothrix espanaensis DSM 44229]